MCTALRIREFESSVQDEPRARVRMVVESAADGQAIREKLTIYGQIISKKVVNARRNRQIGKIAMRSMRMRLHDIVIVSADPGAHGINTVAEAVEYASEIVRELEAWKRARPKAPATVS